MGLTDGGKKTRSKRGLYLFLAPVLKILQELLEEANLTCFLLSQELDAYGYTNTLTAFATNKHTLV